MRDWRNDYRVTVAETQWHGVPIRHVRVRRYSGKDGITWDMLQRIKDDVLGPDVMAIEVYPPARELVNEANIRHLWEVPFELLAKIPSLY